jgi:hypothetical protein
MKPGGIAGRAQSFLVEHPAISDRAQHEGSAAGRKLMLYLARDIGWMDRRDVCSLHIKSPSAISSA